MVVLHDTNNQTAASREESVLLVQLANEVYALSAADIREILRYRGYTPVPGAPSALPGILNHRGVILPVVDMHQVLGFDDAPITRASRLIVVSRGQVDMALLVAGVLDLASIASDTLEPPPASLDPTRMRLFRGVATFDGQPIVFLNLDELIAVLRA